MDRQRQANRLTDRQTDRKPCSHDITHMASTYTKKYLTYLTSKYNHTIRKYCLKYLFQLFVKTSLIYY